MSIRTKKFNGRRSVDRLYNSQWEKYRLFFLNANKKCYACGEPASIVDHLIPHKGDFKLFWKMDNYIPLCKPDHDTITNLFDRNYVPGSSSSKKLQWIKDQRDMNDLTFKVKIVPFGSELEEWISVELVKDVEFLKNSK